ncbi:MAG: class E sortase [Mycobacteriales bacterium]
MIASVEAEGPDRERRAADADEPTEVIGPFDIGLWTVHGKEAGPSPERVRARAAPTTRSRSVEQPVPPGPPRERAPRDRPRPASPDGGQRDRPPSTDREDARLAAVVAAAGRGTTRAGAGRTAGPEGPTRDDHIRAGIRGLAEVLITVGLVLLLFSGYEVWFTGVLNHRAQDRLKSELDRRWETGDDPVIVAEQPARPGAKVRSIPLGEGFALIYIPDFGTDYVYTIVEGTGTAQLEEGPGHYVRSVLPGQVGNFAVAGHRVGKGSPFLNLDKLKVGSAIVIRTKTYWYTYRVLGDPATKNPRAIGPLGIPGMQVVEPRETGVIGPVPDRAGVTPTQRLLTLTTCHPKFSARQRLVIHAQLEGSPRPAGKGPPPALASGGG